MFSQVQSVQHLCMRSAVRESPGDHTKSQKSVGERVWWCVTVSEMRHGDRERLSQWWRWTRGTWEGLQRKPQVCVYRNDGKLKRQRKLAWETTPLFMVPIYLPYSWCKPNVANPFENFWNYLLIFCVWKCQKLDLCITLQKPCKKQVLTQYVLAWLLTRVKMSK